MHILTLLIISVIYLFVLFVNTDGSSIYNRRKATNYLRTFGYINIYCGGYDCGLTAEVIKKFQRFANLDQTGRLDIPTIKKLNAARCGNSDVEEISKDYIVWTKRNKKLITWRYDKNRERYDISWETVSGVLKKAMSFWSSKANIEFKEDTVNEPDIWIYFAKYNHGDPFVFDGSNIVFAHAFYPISNNGIAGDIHFDWSEKFTLGSSGVNGRNLLWVATHELGHSLGLTHSNNINSIMNPWYPGTQGHVSLHQNDIRAIQHLYGRKRTSCLPLGITAIWRIPKNGFYGLSTNKNRMYTFGRKGELLQGPLSLSRLLKQSGLRKAIDAVLTAHLGSKNKEQMIFFSGKQYSVYTGTFKYVSGPHSIHDAKAPLKVAFPWFVKKIDAAFKWKRNGKVYFFFKGVYDNGYYYRYNIKTKRFEGGYKLTSKGWGALGWRGPDAAFSFSGDDDLTIFIKGNDAYKFNDRLARLMPEYPKDIRSSDIFRCPI